MSRTVISGFEMNSGGELYLTSGVVIDTTSARSGSYGLHATVSSSNTLAVWQKIPSGGTALTAFRSCRFYMKVISAPSVSTGEMIICAPRDTGNVVKDRLCINNNLTLTVKDASDANAVTSSNALSLNTWYLIEFDVGWSSGSGRRVYVDGTIWASSAATATSAWLEGTLGLYQTGLVVTSGELYFDDVIWDDASFATSGLPGPGTVLLLTATAGNNANSWTDGGGGTGDIHGAIDNIPPVGVAAATNGTKIKNVATGSNLDYTATMQTYSDAGIPFDAKINAVMAICNDGEAVTTGTKAGAVYIASNPTQSAPTATNDGSFDYGGDTTTAIGTFPTGWATHYGVVAASPSVTLTTAPTVAVRKIGSTNREVAVDFLALYVDYTPRPQTIENYKFLKGGDGLSFSERIK